MSGRLDGVRCVAFELPDRGEAELLNSREQPARVEVEWNGRTVAFNLPARSITTARWLAR